MKAFLLCSLVILSVTSAKENKNTAANGKKRSIEHGLFGTPLVSSFGSAISPAISYSSGNGLLSGEYLGSYGAPITYGSFGTATGLGLAAGTLNNQETHEVRHVTEQVPVAVPQPYPVTITKTVPVPQPYTVSVPKPYAVPVEVKVPVHIPKPYAVKVPQPVSVPVPVKVPVDVPKPYPVYHTKTVKVEVEKPVYVRVPYKVKVPVPQPYKVEVPTPVLYNVPKPIYVKEPHIAHTYSTVGTGNVGFYPWQGYAPNFYPGLYGLGSTFGTVGEYGTGQVIGGVGSVSSSFTDFGGVTGISEFPSVGGSGILGSDLGGSLGEVVTIGSGGTVSTTPPTSGVVSDENDSVTVEGRSFTPESTTTSSSTAANPTPTPETQTVQEQTLPSVEVTSPGEVDVTSSGASL